MKWKLFAAAIAGALLSASVAIAVTGPTVNTGTLIDQVKIKRGNSATVNVPINQNPGGCCPLWVSVPDMVVVVNFPALPSHFAMINLHTEDVPHVTDGSGRHVDYRLVLDGQPMRTDLLPTDRPILGSFDSTGVIAPGNHAFQMQVAIPDYYCTTPSCGLFPGEPIPTIGVAFSAPWQFAVQRVLGN